MKLFSPYAVLLMFIMSNTAMWGQQARTVRFSLKHKQEVDYCLTGKTNGFSLTIDTKLDKADSLQAYDVSIDYDVNKVRILAAQRTGTISNLIPPGNFFFGSDGPGKTRVYGYLDFGKGVLYGEGSLFALRGEWLSSKCEDSTVCTISFFEPGFEFGIGPRTVIIDSIVLYSNRTIDTSETNIDIKASDLIIDSVEHNFIYKQFNASASITLAKAVGNEGIIIKPLLSGDTINSMIVKINDAKNLTYSITQQKEVMLKKITVGEIGTINVSYQMIMPVQRDTSITRLKLLSAQEKCDCIQTHDSAVTELVLIRLKEPDTLVSVDQTDTQTEQEICTDYFDILGRFIETDCFNEYSALNVKRRKAIKIGTNLIKYID